jgi:hypothetical protein
MARHGRPERAGQWVTMQSSSRGRWRGGFPRGWSYTRHSGCSHRVLPEMDQNARMPPHNISEHRERSGFQQAETPIPQDLDCARPPTYMKKAALNDAPERAPMTVEPARNRRSVRTRRPCRAFRSRPVRRCTHHVVVPAAALLLRLRLLAVVHWAPTRPRPAPRPSSSPATRAHPPPSAPDGPPV